MKSLRYTLRRGKRLLLLAVNAGYDLARYFRYSSKSGTPATTGQLPFQLMVQYHAIEKGLSLRDVRLGFGQAHLDELCRLLRDWQAHGLDCRVPAYVGAISALESYVSFHEQRGHAVPRVKSMLQEFRLPAEVAPGDATVGIRREEIQRQAASSYDQLAASRHSIRDFDSRPIDPALIEQAVALASYSPSACNRQSWRVHALRDPPLKRLALEMQNGNRGFRESIDLVLVVACDVRAFGDALERNQAWIDGGMFAMSLLHALHYLGLGACALNWCTTWSQDRQFHRALSIPGHELILMLVAVGHLPERLQVARSGRRPVSEILKVH